ncbi:MAG: hypothetical protein WCF57_20325 [Pyrinomonadaceae bacterium]
MNEPITAILEKLSSPRIALTAVLASFILLPFFIASFVFQHITQFAQINSGALIPELAAILAAEGDSKTLIAIITLSVILVTSCCFLVIEFIRLVKESLRALNEKVGEELKKIKRLYSKRLAQGKLDQNKGYVLDFLQGFLFIHPFLTIFFDIIFVLVFGGACVFIVFIVILLALSSFAP